VKCCFVICVALALPACKDHELKQLEAVRKEVCACKTVKCADAAMAKLPQKNVKTSTKSQGLANEMLHCLGDLYSADRPTLDPDAPAPATTGP